MTRNVEPLTLVGGVPAANCETSMSKSWRDITIAPDASVHQAWEAIDRGAMQIALVVDHTGHLIGTVTDGDIRAPCCVARASTSGSPRYERQPTTGLAEETHDSWQRTMHRHSLRHLPILDPGVRCGPCSIQHAARTRALDASGDHGRRPRRTPAAADRKHTQTDDPVGPKPVPETIIENFADQGFVNIYLCLNYKGRDDPRTLR